MTVPANVSDLPAIYLAQALRAFLHRGEFARFHGLPELLAATARVDPDRVSVTVEPGPRLRMEIHGEPGESWADYAAGPPDEQQPIVSPPAVRAAADKFAPRSGP